MAEMSNEQAAVEFFKERITAETPIAKCDNLPQGLVDMARHSIKLYTTALSALRDAQARQEGCEWCEEENLDVEYYYTLPTAPRSFQTRRNYCHKCGRRLATVSKTERVEEEEE